MRDIIQQTINNLQKAIDEADKTASVKRIERVLGGIDPKILEAEVITDLEDLRTAIADYHGITRAGLTPEEYQEEKEAAFEAIQEAVDGLDIDEDALESLEAPPVKETWQMTRKEFIKQDLERYRKDAKDLGFSLNEQLQTKLSGEQHEKTVRKALSIGKPIPPEVLKDYPGLVKTKTRREQIMEFDYNHTLEDLKKMAREKGVSPSGTKHEIIGRLI